MSTAQAIRGSDSQLDLGGLPDRLVSPDVARDFLSVELSTLATWRSEGCGPKYVKLSGGRSGAIRYKLSELLRFASDPQAYGPRPVAKFRKPTDQRDGQPRINSMRARSRRGKTRGKV